jgi:hypothetical protein
MDLRKQLEGTHSKASTEAIVRYIGGDRIKFAALLEIFLNGEQRLSQRAAWPLSYVGTEHPELIAAHLPELIEKLREDNTHDAIRRNILRALQETEVPEKFQGLVVDHCFRFIRNEMLAVAIRAFAITVATQICKKYPELAEELRFLLLEISALPHSPAISVRIKKALKELS